MKLKLNAPVTLWFGILCAAIMAIDLYVKPGFVANRFLAPGEGFDQGNFWHYFSLIAHPFAHRTWDHLLQNILYIQLLGPVLEEKYSSKTLAGLIFATALFTGILNILLLQPSSIQGASGIVFMMILLVSFSNISIGEIPITFIIIAILYPLKEIIMFLKNPGLEISLTAHISGGLMGTIYGFLKHIGTPKKKESPSAVSEATVVN